MSELEKKIEEREEVEFAKAVQTELARVGSSLLDQNLDQVFAKAVQAELARESKFFAERMKI